MLSYQDCVEMTGLTEEAIQIIADHKNIPEMAAVEMVSYLMHTPEGIPMINRIILDDIELAHQRGDEEKVVVLKSVLKHFIDTHPHNPSKA